MRKIVLYISFIIPLFAAGQISVSADSISTFAKKFLGSAYCYGACSPQKGFDCSGFVYYVFNHFDIKVPRASMDYEKEGRKVAVDSCKRGDIIVFTGTNDKNKTPGHVGIIISNDSGNIIFIHSSSGHKKKGVILTNYTQSVYYKNRFIKIVRVPGVT